MTTTDSTHGRSAPKNLVARDFTARTPDRVWVADTTYLPAQAGFIYLVVVLDLFARRVVGWSVGDALSAQLAPLGLRRAIDARGPQPGLVVHTDRGGEFLSGQWQAVLHAAGAVASASATGKLLRQRGGRELRLDPRVRGAENSSMARNRGR